MYNPALLSALADHKLLREESAVRVISAAAGGPALLHVCREEDRSREETSLTHIVAEYPFSELLQVASPFRVARGRVGDPSVS